MITCSVCGKENDDLAVICTSCRGFLQSKVDAINLFETFWQLAESPVIAFKKIVLARHKNYVLFLGALVGMSIFFAFLWHINAGNYFENVLVLLGLGGLAGIPFGLLFTTLLAGFIVIAVRWMGGKATLQNARAVATYAGMPLILSLVVVLPLEVAVFGREFFGSNPPPLALNPVAYLGLLAFDALAALWAIVLLYKGVKVLSGFGVVKSLGATTFALVVPAVLVLARRLF
jgi:hypothetical protein